MREGLFHNVLRRVSFTGFLGLNWVNIGIPDPGTEADTLGSKNLKVINSYHGSRVSSTRNQTLSARDACNFMELVALKK